MKGTLLLALSYLTATRSFVLNTVNSSALTTHDLQQLLDLLVEERHLRSQLETQVNQLMQEMHDNKGRHQLELLYTQLSFDFNNLSL